MASIKARLNTAEHVLFRILLDEYGAKQKGLQLKDDTIRIGIECAKNLKAIPEEIEEKVNAVIRKNIEVKKYELDRKKAEKMVDTSLVPKSVKKLRIVEIGDFDRQACATPHVDNTREIGTFKILKVEKKGKNNYNITSTVSSERKGEKEKFELVNARGVRDFLPEESINRQKVIDVFRKIFEKYGYSPLETPAIERYDVLSAKFAGGAEITKEIFKLRDQGGRELGLKYDLTVPMCKVVGMNPNIPKPFKRYQIQTVWRDGPVKLGRYREFLQCDADVVGSKSMLVDAEALSIANEVFKTLGLDIMIKVNNRKLMNGILDYAGIKKNKMDAILSIDKLEKFGIKTVKDELETKGFDKKQIENVLKVLRIKGKNKELLEKIGKMMKSEDGKEGAKELKELLEYCEMMGVEIQIDISLARGLEYYTGPVYEVYLKKSKVTSSVMGGGRFDNIIGMYIGKGEYPATGMSFGFEPILDALKEKKMEGIKTVTQVLVIPIKTLKESLKIVKTLRKLGVKTEIDLMGRGISNNLSYANSLGIPYVVFAGKKELAKKKVKLRDMKSGKEKMLKIGEIPQKIA